jgi:hypothetical protein
VKGVSARVSSSNKRPERRIASARPHNSQVRGDAELVREEERAQIEEAAVLATARETD